MRKQQTHARLARNSEDTEMSKKTGSFANSPIMRVVAILVAIGVGILSWWTFQDAEEQTADRQAPVYDPQALEAMGTSDSVQSCINAKILEIYGWVENVIMDEAAAKLSKGRARNMCRSRRS